MKILVVGGGGREHALCWKLAQSSRVKKLYCAPGNAGIAFTRGETCGQVACVDIQAENLDGLARFVRRERIDLTVVGPEGPLVEGIVDRWAKEEWVCFGPTKCAAELEGSKAFAKTLLRKHGIPTADFHVFSDAEKAMTYCKERDGALVVKADGLAAGKGVILTQNGEEAAAAVKKIMLDNTFGAAGAKVIIEETLKGVEASVLCFSDGQTLALLPSAQDHKRVGDGDTGPNTGGMGAYSPAPCVTPEIEDRIVREILVPTLHAMNREDRPYKGVLYAGVMLTESGPKVLEYNCRFGDPECQCLLPRLETDLVDVMERVLANKLAEYGVTLTPDPAVCVVLTASGYPGSYKKGDVIEGLNAEGQLTNAPDTVIFHSGTARNAAGEVTTHGGRVLGVTATAATLPMAVTRAYQAAERIRWQGMQYRKDIAHQALKPRA